MASVLAPISIGELLDKITILEIKRDHLTTESYSNVQNELGKLLTVLDQLNLKPNDKVVARLREINTKLGEIENRIREKESKMDFGMEFIELARSVYKTNEQRSLIKRQINVVCGSEIFEEKFYENY